MNLYFKIAFVSRRKHGARFELLIKVPLAFVMMLLKLSLLARCESGNWPTS